MGPKSRRPSQFGGQFYDTMKDVTKFTIAINTLLFWCVVFSTLLLLLVSQCDSKVISKSVLCADIKCDEIYGDGKTTNQYLKDSDEMLAFKKDANVKIFGKTVDGKQLLVQIKEKRGFVPNSFVKESKIYNPNLEHKVDIDLVKIINGQKVPVSQSQPISNADFVYTGSSSSSATNLDGSIGESPIIDQTSTETDHMLYASKSPIVIDGTTFNEDILRTPSPTYNPEIAVTKTVSIEANFNEQQAPVEAAASPDQNPQHNSVDVDGTLEKGKIFKMLNVNSSIHHLSPENNTETLENKVDNLTNLESQTTATSDEAKELPKESTEKIPEESSEKKLEESLEKKSEETSEVYLNQTFGDYDDSVVVESEEETNSSAEISSNNESVKMGSESSENRAPTVAPAPPEMGLNIPVEENLQPQKSFVETSETEPKIAENFIPPLTETTEELKNSTTLEEEPKILAQELPVTPAVTENLQNLEQNSSLNDPVSESVVEPNFEPIVSKPVEEIKVQELPEIVPDLTATILNQTQQEPAEPQQVESVPNVSDPIAQQPDLVLPQESNHMPEVVSPILPVDSVPPVYNQPDAQNQSNENVSYQDTLTYSEPYMNPSVDYSPTPNSINPTPNLDIPNNNNNVHASHYHAHAQEIANPTENLSWKSSIDSAASPSPSVNTVNAAEILHSKPITDNEPQPPPSVEKENYSNSVNSNLNSEQDNYSKNTEVNRSKRRLLAERVAFVSVINDIIPDEVELFFENFNLSLHAVVFTSIVAFSWCLMKVFLYFVSSSKTERELRESNTQSLRKIYYFEAEKDKIREEMNLLKEKLSNQGRDLHQAETRKNQFELENERIRNEIQLLKKENISLRNQADETPLIYSKLDNVSGDYEKCKDDNRKLKTKVEQLESTIANNAELINKLEQTAKSNNEEIESLNDKLQLLSEENDEFRAALKQSEENFDILQLENKELKESKSQLNEEIKNMKDELLSLQEKSNNYEEENVLLKEKLATATEQLAVTGKELEEKSMDIASMQALLNKLNKNISKEQYRRQLSSEVNGDLVDELAGDDHQQQQTGNNANSTEFNGDEKSEEDETDNNSDMQDIVKLQLRLTNLELEKQHLQESYNKLESQVSQTKDDIETTKKANDKLQEEIEIAAKDRLKAVMELEVLSKYYKEKELEYGKEIGVQHLKRQQKEEDADSLVSDLEVTKEENELLKKQVKSTKKELEDTERRYKSQLNQLEKQSHENWIAARNAERKYEESKAEATALRQTLTLSVKSPPPNDLSMSGYNLDDTASSISSLPDGLNTSLQLPPPPPPPPFPLMMANSMLAMAPSSSSGPQSFYDPNNDPSVVPGWNPPPFALQPPAPMTTTNSYQPPIDSSKNAQSGSYPNSLDYEQRVSQSQPASYSSSYAQQPQPPAVNNVQPAITQYNAYSKYQSINQWGESHDPSRNTYSPMSQRSATHTPLTSTGAVTYDIQRQQQQYQQYDHLNASQSNTNQQPNVQQSNTNDRSSVGPQSATNNPFSISGPYSHPQQPSSGYHMGYNQQQQQPVDQNVYSRPPATVTPSQSSHQIWTAGQSMPDLSQQQQQQSHHQLNHNHNQQYSAYPTNNQTHNPNYPASNVPSSNVPESNSRPASVHTQMV